LLSFSVFTAYWESRVMVESRGIVREIAWRELFPWLMLVRVFRLSIQPPVLVMALLATFLISAGWFISASLFVIPRVEEVSQVEKTPFDHQLLADAHNFSKLPGASHDIDRNYVTDLRGVANRMESPIWYVFNRIGSPIWKMYHPHCSLKGFAFYLFGTLWTMAVWAFAGGFITRYAVIDLGREEQARVSKVLQLTLQRWGQYFTAPLYPLLGTVLIALLALPVGWMLRLDLGTIVAGILWIFVLLGSAFSALMLVWLLFGWPLMWPTISAEETGDAFEAMSRSFAYTFQKPLHYLFFALVAAVLGFFAWGIIDFACHLTVDCAHWSVSWGAGAERTAHLFESSHVTGESKPPSAMFKSGLTLIRGVEGLLRAVSEAFAYAFFWVSAAGIYLLMRQAVDHAEFDEVWIEDDIPRQPLPQFKTDVSGVPTPAATEEQTTETPPPATLPIDQNQAE
jgi:hypothetical protein